MQTVRNPFIVSGYVADDYFCDREVETVELIKAITNGRNMVIVSPRRMGKTGLIEHCFHQKEIVRKYHTFFRGYLRHRVIERIGIYSWQAYI